MSNNGFFYEDLSVGSEITTDGITICDAHIVNFCGVGGDFFAVHVDDEAARALGFDRKIAHGLMIVSMVDGLKMRCAWQLQAVATLALNWNFKQPVFSGDRIYAKIRVESRRETKRHDRGIINFAFDVLNQDGACVQTGTSVTMMRRRPAPALVAAPEAQ